MNNKKKHFIISNYSLKTQIIIINFLTASVALFFLIIFNFFLLNNDKNIVDQKKLINVKINQITEYLSQNAIIQIPTFDDTCNRASEGGNREIARIKCNKKKLSNNVYLYQPDQLDPTYTQKYIYSNFLDSEINVKVFKDDGIEFADTTAVYVDKDEVVISDIDIKNDEKYEESIDFYKSYKKIYFHYFNLLKRYFDENKIYQKGVKKSIINNDIEIKKMIETKLLINFVDKDKDNNFRIIYLKPIIKDKNSYGTVLIDSMIVFDNDESASQSILLTNFFIFFISIMFLLSFFFSKSIVNPIKILSHNTNLERDKTLKNKNIINYPARNDEIGKLSNDIKSMSNDLKRRINEMEEFASDVSHELKNPLAGLKSSSDLLKTGKLDQINKKLLIENMGKDIDRMNVLISDIANYTITGAEISEEFFERFELIKFLFNFKDSLSYKDFTIKIKNEEKKIYLTINKNKFLQVLHNLIDNASSYIPKKSIILISIRIKNQDCIINFIDQGVGISLEYKDKIFDRFYTDRNKNRSSHSGLGLSICKKIIDSFGGSINLIKSSHSDFKGACFEIKLPLKDL